MRFPLFHAILSGMGINKRYKDTVFSFLFSDPATLRELYEALEGITLPPDVPIKIDTLEDALYRKKINDISFEIGDKLVVLIEHQSTINPNMPVRLLSYIARIYEKILSGKRSKLYGKKALTLPRPEFIVLYNGVDPFPDTLTIRLSDAFADVSAFGLKDSPLALELTARVYNINEGHNQAIVGKSERLNWYALFIGKVRENKAAILGGKRPAELTEAERDAAGKAAMEVAIKWCIAQGILKDFLETHGSEVINMLFDEWNLEEALVVEREEGREEGIIKTARNALAEGASLEFVQKITGMDIETIKSLSPA